MRKGRALVRQQSSTPDWWGCSMCNWVGFVPVAMPTFGTIPKYIQDAFKSHYCSKYPVIEPFNESRKGAEFLTACRSEVWVDGD